MAEQIVREQVGGEWVTTYGESGGGGSTPGAAVVRGPFSFAYDTPNLNAGVAFYTPTVGDILLDAWVEVTTAWDGTTPLGDVGAFNPDAYGWFANCAGPLDMTKADSTVIGGLDGNVDLMQLSGLNDLGSVPYVNQVSGAGPSLEVISPPDGFRYCPARFTSANPLKVVVSQDGTAGGTAPGASQGAAKIYIVTATPVAF